MATPATWATYRASIGDRSPMFAALASRWPVRNALYPGSYLDISPSLSGSSVTYVDTDRRAARYFADTDQVSRDVRADTGGQEPGVTFLPMDYTEPLPLPPASFDLLISLFAGPVWDHCQTYLRPGGLLLANSSHGDACIAALDPRTTLLAAVHHRADRYRLATENLGGYLVPTNDRGNDAESIRRSGRGIAYTRPAFAYLFRCHMVAEPSQGGAMEL